MIAQLKGIFNEFQRGFHIPQICWQTHLEGWIGTILGRHNVNIANMSLARNKQRGNALNVIEIDSPVPDAVLAEFEKTAGITQVRAFEL